MFKKYLINYMKINAISQQDLSKLTGDSQQAISDFLSKDGNPQRKTRDKYFKVLPEFKDFYKGYTSKSPENLTGKTPLKGGLFNYSIEDVITHIYDNKEIFKKNVMYQLFIEGEIKDEMIIKFEELKKEMKEKMSKKAVKA